LAFAPYLRAFGIGAVAGLRTFTAPAAILGAEGSTWTGLGRLLAAGELIGDKLPATPSRLSPPALAARVVSGGWCGGIVARRLGASRLAGIGCGVLGAFWGAVCGYNLRRYLVKARGIPDAALAVGEDAVAVWGARLATRRTS
jgi:uncharacterized membrane protein